MSRSNPRGPAARRRTTSRPKLSPEQQTAYLADSNQSFVARRRRRPAAIRGVARAAAVPPNQITVVAEGDSWFDYKPAYLTGKDLLGHLQNSGRINVYRVSKAGDTIENMVYGTAFDGKFRPKPSQIDQTLAAIERHQPDAFLFSGGGNDLAGTELEGYLDHAAIGSASALRLATVQDVFDRYLKTALFTLIAKVRAVKPGLPVFLHGYDYVVPDGRDVNLLGWTFSGPWLRPALTKKRYLDDARRAAIIRELLDCFNRMLAQVAAASTDVHYVDFRGVLNAGTGYKTHWANELHPTSVGFKLIAARLEASITARFP